MPLINSGFIAFATPPNRTFQATRQATPKRPKRGKVKGGGKTQHQQQVQQGSAATNQAVHLPTDVAFKTFILNAVKEMHGEVGSLVYPVDVLSWDAVSGEGRLRVPAKYVGALSSCSYFSGSSWPTRVIPSFATSAAMNCLSSLNPKWWISHDCCVGSKSVLIAHTIPRSTPIRLLLLLGVLSIQIVSP